MLSQKYRFHSRGGVNYTYQKGSAVRSSNLSLIYNYNERGFRRFAVVVSKKVSKTAVSRNRIRRRVYEAIRLEFPDDLPTNDYIFVVHSPVFLTIPFRDVRRAVWGLFERLRRDS